MMSGLKKMLADKCGDKKLPCGSKPIPCNTAKNLFLKQVTLKKEK